MIARPELVFSAAPILSILFLHNNIFPFFVSRQPYMQYIFSFLKCLKWNKHIEVKKISRTSRKVFNALRRILKGNGRNCFLGRGKHFNWENRRKKSHIIKCWHLLTDYCSTYYLFYGPQAWQAPPLPPPVIIVTKREKTMCPQGQLPFFIMGT